MGPGLSVPGWSQSVANCRQLETVIVLSVAHPRACAHWVYSRKRDMGSQHLEERPPRGRGPTLPVSLVQSGGVLLADWDQTLM